MPSKALRTVLPCQVLAWKLAIQPPGDGEEIDGEEDDEEGADLPIDESIEDAEDGSPASISAEWASRVEFLHSLSEEKAYTQMVKHLESIQVRPCSGFQHIYATITLIL